MLRFKSSTFVVLAVLVISLSLTTAASNQKNKTKPKPALTQKNADDDFKFQGEYSGTIETENGDLKYGIQVIAKGAGQFDAVGYPGGLPGDGWNGTDKVFGAGKREGDTLKLVGEHGLGIVNNNGLAITNLNGDERGKLKKVLRKSTTLGMKPPTGAVVLFDGSSTKEFPGGKMTKDGLLIQGVTSQKKFQNFSLHLEFMLSYMPYARGQGRSNSGFYAQGRYEVQILDSFGLEGKHNECGGIYKVSKPSVNMCFPPLSWQTYDVDFTAAKFDESGKKITNAKMTVKHNGVVIQKDVEVPKSTTAAPLKEGSVPGPVYIQNHGNPVRFRNIWVREKK